MWSISATSDADRAVVAHELCTPLHAILGFAELLDGPDRTDADLEAIAHIISGGRRMLALVERMLSMPQAASDPHGVADASDGSDPLGPCLARPEFLPQVGDVDVDDMVVADPTGSPHPLQQLHS
ncbi:MAG: His Kinase (phospho-acceptor) domain [Actinomycetota bacterium]|jgi:hypothetical protein